MITAMIPNQALPISHGIKRDITALTPMMQFFSGLLQDKSSQRSMERFEGNNRGQTRMALV
jgi:hypothetical protein